MKIFGLTVVLASALAMLAFVIHVAYYWYQIWDEIFSHASY